MWMRRPAMAGGRARHLLWPACHGTRGGWKPCGWLTARQLELSRLGQRVRLERTPGPGARAWPGPGTRSRMLTGPSRVLPVPEGDHRAQRVCRGDPARLSAVSLPGAVMDPAGLARPWAAARAPGADPRARHAGIGRGETRRGCHSSLGMLTLIEYELRASQIEPVAGPESSNPTLGDPGHISLGIRGKLRVCAGAGKFGSYLDDLAPGGVRAASDSA